MLPNTEEQDVTRRKWLSNPYDLRVIRVCLAFCKSICAQPFSCNYQTVFVGLPVYDTISFGRQDAYP